MRRQLSKQSEIDTANEDIRWGIDAVDSARVEYTVMIFNRDCDMYNQDQF